MVNPDISVIVPAAGQGKRMDADMKKQFMLLNGTPILIHTLRKISAAPRVANMVVVGPEDEVEMINDLISSHKIQKVKSVVAGGATRQESVANGFDSFTEPTDLLMVHDGVRPFITDHMIANVADAALKSGAAIVAIKVSDTIKNVDGNEIKDTISRDGLYHAQTPQCIRWSVFDEALRSSVENNFAGTDEASLVEHLGKPVSIVTGSRANIKITTPDDIKLAEALLESL